MNDDMTPDTAPPAEPALPAESTPRAPKGRARRVVLAVLPAVLVLGAVGGAAAYTKVTVDSADRTVTTKVWGEGAHKPAKDPAGDVGPGQGRYRAQQAAAAGPGELPSRPGHG